YTSLLSGTGHHRDLHSFPTRRSSDLFNNEDDEGSWLEKRVADTDYKTAEDTIINNELGEAIYNCLSKLPPKQATVFRLKTIEGLDRKSTRLNSSHVKISYAVFCLKKK